MVTIPAFEFCIILYVVFSFGVVVGVWNYHEKLKDERLNSYERKI